jgi:hypothetical protein
MNIFDFYVDPDREDQYEEQDGWMDWMDENMSDDETPDHPVHNESRWDD